VTDHDDRQPELFPEEPKPPRSWERARAERDDALERVELHAGEDWNEYADGFLDAAAERWGAFTTDDLWDGGLVQPPNDPRALGAVMRRARARGVIVATGEYRQSVRRHLAPIPVWRSRIYREEP